LHQQPQPKIMQLCHGVVATGTTLAAVVASAIPPPVALDTE